MGNPWLLTHKINFLFPLVLVLLAAFYLFNGSNSGSYNPMQSLIHDTLLDNVDKHAVNTSISAQTCCTINKQVYKMYKYYYYY